MCQSGVYGDDGGWCFTQIFYSTQITKKTLEAKKKFVYTKKKTCRNDLDDIFREKKSLIVKKYVLFEENA